jgi:hypothetical protein
MEHYSRRDYSKNKIKWHGKANLQQPIARKITKKNEIATEETEWTQLTPN